MIKEIIKEMKKDNGWKKVSPRYIAQEIADYFDIDEEEAKKVAKIYNKTR